MTPAEQIELIKKRVAEHFGHTLEELNGESREVPLSTHRQIAMVLARKLTGASFPVLARSFKRTNHNSIQHAMIVVPAKLHADRRLNKSFNKLLAECAAATP